MRSELLSLSVLTFLGILVAPDVWSEAPFSQDSLKGYHFVFDLTGDAKRLPPWEQEAIIRIARQAGVDPRLLAAVRLTENGGPGREFGVLSVPAPTYDDQERVARSVTSILNSSACLPTNNCSPRQPPKSTAPG